jgi:hypothetical protein
MTVGPRSGDAVVEVELNGPSRRSMLRHLGSLTERYGMSMYRDEPPSSAAQSERVSIVVPRAHDQHEAEQVVASLLESIRTWLHAKHASDGERVVAERSRGDAPPAAAKERQLLSRQGLMS